MKFTKDGHLIKEWGKQTRGNGIHTCIAKKMI